MGRTTERFIQDFNRALKNQKGFTLTEIMIVTVLTFLLITTVIMIFFQMNKSFEVIQHTQEQTSELISIQLIKLYIRSGISMMEDTGVLKIIKDEARYTLILLDNNTLKLEEYENSNLIKSSNVVDEVSYFHIHLDSPHSVTLNFEINGETYHLTEYCRR